MDKANDDIRGTAIAHLYNLCKNAGYQAQRKPFTSPRSVKHMGYSHILQQYANPINAFYAETFNPWLNLHRPCLFATEVTRPKKGQIVKCYRPEAVKTPLACRVQLRHRNGCRSSPAPRLTLLRSSLPRFARQTDRLSPAIYRMLCGQQIVKPASPCQKIKIATPAAHPLH